MLNAVIIVNFIKDIVIITGDIVKQEKKKFIIGKFAENSNLRRIERKCSNG